MTEQEFIEFCEERVERHVDLNDEIFVPFALDLLSAYYMEHPHGSIPTLRDVFNQIKKINEITV